VSRVSIGCLVEGDGEVVALPILIRRIASEVIPEVFVHVPRPRLVPRNHMTASGNAIGRAIDRLAPRLSRPAGFLLMLDRDDEPDPSKSCTDLAAHMNACRSDCPSIVVMPDREYEAWFLAAAESLRSRRGLRDDLATPPNPDGIRGAKEWLVDRAAGESRYGEVADQAALTECFDMAAARANSPSFALAYAEIARLLRELAASPPAPEA
jgi:Domain of unknown function (DUF4276)